MLLECWVIASLLAPSQAPQKEVTAGRSREGTHAATLSVEPKAGSGLLVIKNDLFDGESLTFVSCEAMIQGEKTSALFPMSLGVKDWKNEVGHWSYTWEFDGKLRLEFSAVARGESVLLRYTLTNGSSESMKHVAIFPCLPSLGAPAFYPGTSEEAQADPSGRKARVGRHDYSELYARLFLFADDKPFTFKESKLAADEKHLAFMRKGEEPLVWGWWANDEKRFDVPLIVESSRDEQYAVALALDRGVQASSNVGDARACIHVVPRFEEIPAGKSVSTLGRIYWMRAQPKDVLARYRKDLEKPTQD